MFSAIWIREAQEKNWVEGERAKGGGGGGRGEERGGEGEEHALIGDQTCNLVCTLIGNLTHNLLMH